MADERKVSFGIQLPADLVARLKAASIETSVATGKRASVASLIRYAIERLIADLEAERGAPYDVPDADGEAPLNRLKKKDAAKQRRRSS